MFFLTHHFYKKGSAYVCALVCAYMHMCACVCVHICVHACIYVCVCVCVCVHNIEQIYFGLMLLLFLYMHYAETKSEKKMLEIVV